MTEATEQKRQPGATGRGYHHGDLKAALLREAERILEKDGLQALTLRAASRAAGVTHTAPKNHFGDLTGLLSELAALGFERLAAALAEIADTADGDAKARPRAMGHAYVGFARAHPGLFALMFRSERLDAERPALRDAIQHAREALREAAFARISAGSAPTQMEIAAYSAALWSLVHGFSVLLLEGRFDGLMRSLPAGEDAESLLAQVFAVTTVGK